MRKLFTILCLLAITACGGGPGPVGPPTPPPVGRPGTEVFAANFTQPLIGLGLSCSGDVPVDCSPLPAQYIYGTFPWSLCYDPAPACYTTNGGVLALTANNPGFPVITRQTFSKDAYISGQVLLNAVCITPDCFGGYALYNGDAVASATPDLATGNWRALYISPGTQPGLIQVNVWSETHIQVLPSQQFPAGTLLTLRIDYLNGVWTYFVNGLSWTESTAAPWSTDTVFLLNDPHAALFVGDINMNVLTWDVYTQ